MSDEMNVDRFAKAPYFDVARVTTTGNFVVNIELCNQDWLDQFGNGDGLFYFVPSPDRDGNDAVAGLRYEPSTGLFEQREKFPDDPNLLKAAGKKR